MEAAISSILFYLFAAIAVLSAFGVVASRNPVTSAMCMAVSFASTAAVLFCMGAQFLGIVQIIVYAGAILVLFLFVVMMLDVKSEESTLSRLPRAIVGVVIAGIFAGMVTKAALLLPGATEGKCPVAALCCDEACTTDTDATDKFGGPLPALKETDTKEISGTKALGETLFTQYNIAFVILSFALLAGTVGAVALGRKIRKD